MHLKEECQLFFEDWKIVFDKMSAALWWKWKKEANGVFLRRKDLYGNER